MRTLIGHRGAVRAAAYLPDGRLVSGGMDKQVIVWEVHGRSPPEVTRADVVVYAVAASPTGRRVAYAGRYLGPAVAYVYEFDPSSGLNFGANQWNPPTLHSSVWSLSYSADGAYLAAACRFQGGGNFPHAGGGRVWGTAPASGSGSLRDHIAFALAFAPTGPKLAVVHANAVTVLDHAGTYVGPSFPLPATYAEAVAFVPHSDALVVAANRYLLFADVTKPGRSRKVRSAAVRVKCVAVSPDGRFLLAGGSPGGVERYDVASRTLVGTYEFGVGIVHAVAIAPDGLTFAVAGEKGLLVADAE